MFDIVVDVYVDLMKLVPIFIPLILIMNLCCDMIFDRK